MQPEQCRACEPSNRVLCALAAEPFFAFPCSVHSGGSESESGSRQASIRVPNQRPPELPSSAAQAAAQQSREISLAECSRDRLPAGNADSFANAEQKLFRV